MPELNQKLEIFREGSRAEHLLAKTETLKTKTQLGNAEVIDNQEVSLQKALQILNPIFRPGSDISCLSKPGVMVGVSVLPKHPLKTADGSQTLVSFLASLSHPSAIFVADSLNKHNVKAMIKNANRPPSDEKALATALENSWPFHQFLGNAIKDMEALNPEKAGWVTLLTWDDVMDNKEGREQQSVVRRHYNETSSSLRTRMDQIALDFLKFRRPMSKNHAARLPHMIDYLLSELPIIITGFEHRGVKFTTLLYPTAVSKVETGSCLANAVWDLAHEIHTKEEFSGLRQELLAISGGRETLPGVPLLPINPEEVAEALVSDRELPDTPKTLDETTKAGNSMTRPFRRQISAGTA